MITDVRELMPNDNTVDLSCTVGAAHRNLVFLRLVRSRPDGSTSDSTTDQLINKVESVLPEPGSGLDLLLHDTAFFAELDDFDAHMGTRQSGCGPTSRHRRPPGQVVRFRGLKRLKPQAVAAQPTGGKTSFMLIEGMAHDDRR